MGLKAHHIPPGLPEKLEAIFFPDADEEIYKGNEPEYRNALSKLDEVVAKAMGSALDCVAPVLSEDRLARVKPVVTEDQMKLLTFWQGRVTPFAHGRKCGVLDGLTELSRLPGASEKAQDWWLSLFCISTKGWRRERSNTFYLLADWWGRDVDNSETANAVRSSVAMVMRSMLSDFPTISEITEFEHTNLDTKRQDNVSLADIARSYVEMSRFARTVASNTNGADINIPSYTLHEIEIFVKETGIAYDRDCGALGSIEQMREIIRSSTGVITPCSDCNSWVRSSNGYGSSCPFHYNQYSSPWILPKMESSQLHPLEAQVYERLAPEIPRFEHSALVVRLALLYHTTPQHIRICIDGETDNCPSSADCAADCSNALAPRERCPFADNCPTQCGQIQVEGRTFPVTDNGSYDSCRVHFFLTAASDSEGDKREEVARVHLKSYAQFLEQQEKLTKKNQKARRKKAAPTENAKADSSKTESSKTDSQPDIEKAELAQQTALF